MVQSQQARRMVDRLAGFKLSPILWKHIKGKKGLSAGRVQSAALKLLYDRSAEINTFVPEEYYEIEGLFQIKGHEIPAILTAVNQEKVEIQSKQEAEELCQRIQGSSFFIAEIKSYTKAKNPPEPFITGTLLEEAHRKLKFTSQKTMKIAQQLFEGIAIHGKTECIITYNAYRQYEDCFRGERSSQTVRCPTLWFFLCRSAFSQTKENRGSPGCT
jgi:DNA topoisomerase I